MYGGNRITVALFCLNSPPFNLPPFLHLYFFILNSTCPYIFLFCAPHKQIGICGETGHPLCEMSVKNVELSEPKASFRRLVNKHIAGRLGTSALTVPFKREQSRTCSSYAERRHCR